MVRVVIVDDEPHSVHRMRELLTAMHEYAVIGEANNGADAIEMINSLCPDVVFLDIQMPVLSGLEVLEQLSCKPMVVFITAYDQFAVKAFEKDGVDYLLKPVSEERFAHTIQRINERRQPVTSEMLSMLRSISQARKWPAHFNVRSRQDILLIPVHDVYYFKAEDRYTFLCTHDNEFIYDATLKELETMLDPEKFIRIHKSYILAIAKIQKIRKTIVSDYVVILSDAQATSLRVGRAYVDVFKRVMKLS